MRSAAIALTASLLAAAPLLGTARAAQPPPATHAAELSLEQAVELVQQRTGARVVRAERTVEGDEVIYRLRLLAADGRVMTVRVHAATGRVE